MKKMILLVVFLMVASIPYAEETRFNVPLENSPSYGPANAPVTIIEFLDFQ